MNEPRAIEEMLAKVKTIAVIGLSDKPGRASFGVSRYMQSKAIASFPSLRKG